MNSYKRLWIALSVVVIGSFIILGAVGRQIISHAPPIPNQVITTDGKVLFTGTEITHGQGAWQSIGGQEIGTVWGHGAYVAPDWTADWLHRESIFTLDTWAHQQGAVSYAALSDEQKAALDARLRNSLRRNTYDQATGNIVILPVRAEAFESLERYYANIFGNGRDNYAIPRDTLSDPVKQRQMAAFFWWTSWAAATDRPG